MLLNVRVMAHGLCWRRCQNCTMCICATFLELLLLVIQRTPVAQWVVRPTHTRFVPGSKHVWCKNPLVVAMIAS